LTRAIEELYIFVPAKVGNSVNPAKFLIPQDSLSGGVPAQRPVAHDAPEARQKIRAFLSSSWSGLQEEFLDQPVISTVLARKGEFYHALLMRVGHVNEGNIDEVPEDIRDFIDRKDVRPFFYLPADAKVFCEKEFVNAYGDTKRVDRLIVFEDKVWVVDFKLSPSDEDSHQKQVQGYVELVRQFYPKHKVSGHILYLQ
jgi:hypothetical protein